MAHLLLLFDRKQLEALATKQSQKPLLIIADVERALYKGLLPPPDKKDEDACGEDGCVARTKPTHPYRTHKVLCFRCGRGGLVRRFCSAAQRLLSSVCVIVRMCVCVVCVSVCVSVCVRVSACELSVIVCTCVCASMWSWVACRCCVSSALDRPNYSM